jgi:hypothetical protein
MSRKQHASTALSLSFISESVAKAQDIEVQSAVIAGWAGRDRHAVEEHIGELEKLGVRRPSSVPIFYRVSSSRLTTAGAIEVLGSTSSGEVEPVLLKALGALWVGVGSDHTDRAVESYEISASKQICDKPIASSFWPLAEVAEHWDRLVLRSYIEEHGKRALYQEAPVSALLQPAELASRYAEGGLADGTMMFCGTIPAIGGIRPARAFSFELEDPFLHRRIEHSYWVREMPVVR